MEEMGVLSSFAGVAVHDAWAPYDTYAAPDHQLCCAHAFTGSGRLVERSISSATITR